MSGNEDDLRAWIDRCDTFEKVHSRNFRHHQVKQYDSRPYALKYLEPCFWIGRCKDLQSLRGKSRLNHFKTLCFVIDREQLERHGRTHAGFSDEHLAEISKGKLQIENRVKTNDSIQSRL